MTLLEFKDLLLTTGLPVHHYHAHKQTNRYIVWAEYGGHNQTADNAITEKAIRVQVDLFTKTEFDPAVEAINSLLDRDDISFKYLCDYEPDTGYIHHIWDTEVA
jgi:hypothetical protein